MSGKKKSGFGVPRWLKLVFALGVLAGIYIIGGYVVLPLVIKPVLVEKLSAALQRPVEIDEIGIDPVSLAVTVKGVRLKTKDGGGVTASLESLFVDAELSSLIKRAVVLREITVTEPYVDVIRRDDGSYNFSYLIQPKGDKKPKKSGEPLRFSLNNIRIIGGSADFHDNPSGAVHTVRDMSVSVPFVSNFGYNQDVFVEPAFRAEINGTPFEVVGKTKPFSKTLETVFDINLNDLSIPRYAAYIPVELGFDVTSGTLDTDIKINYIEYIGKKDKDLEVFGSIMLSDFKVEDKAGAGLVELPRMAVDIMAINPLKKELRFSSIRLTRPSVKVVRLEDGSINLLNVLPKSEPPEEPAPAAKGGSVGLGIEVNLFDIEAARVEFEDRTVEGPFRSVISPLDVTMVNFRNIPGWRTSLSVEALTDAGERLVLASGITAEPVGAEGTVSLSGVPVPRYSAYFPKELHAKVSDAVFGFSTRFDYSREPGAEKTSVTDTEVSLKSLKVRIDGDDADVLRLDSFTVTGGAVDALAKKAVIGGITLEGGKAEVLRGPDGKLNVSRMYAAGEKPQPPQAGTDGDAAKEPWEVTVSSFGLTGFEAGFRDASTREPVEVRARDIAVSAENISTAPDVTGKASVGLKLGKKGSIKVAGPVRVNPPYAKLGLDIADIGIARYQPYVPEDAGVIIVDGYVNAAGEAVYEATDSGPKASYRGMASITQLSAVDTINLEDMVNWKSLYVKGIDAGYAPVELNVEEVALTDFFARLTITEDGRLNIRPKAKPAGTEEGAEEAVEGEPPPEPETEPQPQPVAKSGDEKPKFKADIKRITLQGGKVIFTDRSLEKTFTASLTELGGHVTGMTSKESGLADVDVKAKYNEFAPIEITGSINPLRDDLFVDIKARFVDMDLSPVTPYSNKFIGYPITKGKLSLNLEYHIENGKLDSKNVLFVDQLTLGDKVDSPTATALPVKFAIALLRDRKGEIHLDLPVTGDLKDPKFSIWGLVVQVVVNLVSKAATSPFALLGAILGGGEELGYLEYGYGLDVIDAPGYEKLDKLAEALYQRPGLKLSISGHVDPERDQDAIKQARFIRALKVEKFRETVGDIEEGDEAAKAVDEMEILPDEYDEYLLLAYEEADFPKPRNIIGMLKDLPPGEMKKLMITGTAVTDDDLRALAMERAEKVKEYILSTGKVEPERVFLVEPESLKPEPKEGVSDARAEFSLE